MHITFQTILPFILAILLIFIIPMLAARNGMSYGQFVKSIFTGFTKKEYGPGNRKTQLREPVLSNGRKNELTQLVSTLLIFVRRNKISMVYPGTVVKGQEQSTILCFVVTGACVYGINCFGYSGSIREVSGKFWKQHMNGQDLQIENPRELSRRQYRLVREVMDRAGMKDVPLEVESVFTNRDVTLLLQSEEGVYDTKGLIRMLGEKLSSEKQIFDPQETALALKKLTVVVKKSGRGKRETR